MLQKAEPKLSYDCSDAAIEPYPKQLPKSSRDPAVELRCILRLRTLNTGPDPIGPDVGALLGWKALLARADGEMVAAHFIAFEGSEVRDINGVATLPPGATGITVFGFGPEAAAVGDQEKGPVLVVMNPFMSDGTVYLSLRGRVAGEATPAPAAP